jgi:hypothetical protein
MSFMPKLRVILELFDAVYDDDAMDGVAINDKNDRCAYFYESNGVTYEFTIMFMSLMSIDNKVQEILEQVANLKLSGVLTDHNYALSLKSNANDYGLTGLGNANFVYGKMLACFFNFIEKHGIPAVLEFDAYDAKTNLTYAKLLKFIERVADLKYRLIDGYGVYILDDVLAHLQEQYHDMATQHINKSRQAMDDDMVKIKQDKAVQRLQKKQSIPEYF